MAPKVRTLGWLPVFAIWIVARAIVFGIWAGFKLTTQGDVLYYWVRTHAYWTGEQNAASTLIEYPTPVVWFMSVPYWLAGQSRPMFVFTFIVIMLVLDLLFALALWRSGSKHRTEAVLFWVAFTAVMGPTTYMRFDLVPAILGGVAILALLKPRPTLAGASVGVGAALKLWPALLYPALLGGNRRSKLRASIGFWVVGLGLALASYLWAGWGRLVSPLTWQQGRGLQIESIWATPVMLARAFAPDSFQVEISRWQAFEIQGAGVDGMLLLSNVFLIVGLASIVVAYLAWLTRPTRTVVGAGMLVLLVVAITIVTNKTFSPQYMMWLGGPMAALLVARGMPRDGRDPDPRERPEYGTLKRTAWWVLGLTLATQLVYPILYEPLAHGGSLLWLATAVLVLRNVAMVWFTIRLIVIVVKMLESPALVTRADRRRADRRGRG